VLFRIARGSGLTGLAGMARTTPLEQFLLHRPFLDIPKQRLIATLAAAGVAFAEDPSNADPKFTRARLRTLMPELASEGLDAKNLARLARRMRRADAAIEAMVEAAMCSPHVSSTDRDAGSITVSATELAKLPAEVALRLIGRAIATVGDEGPVELGKLETLMTALAQTLADDRDGRRFRRTLAGAVLTLFGNRIVIARAPRRRTARNRLKTGS
jgi:tRNA(Ile)-lysidine synthase